jgi:hypothetical protein
MTEGAEIAAAVVGILEARKKKEISLDELKVEIEKVDISTGRKHKVAFVALSACHALGGAAFAGLIIATACILLDEDCGPFLPSKISVPPPIPVEKN